MEPRTSESIRESSGHEWAPNHRVGWLALALAVGCILVARNLLGTVVFASWMATTFYALYLRLAAKTHPVLAALVMTFAIVVVIMGPLALGGVIITTRVVDLRRAPTIGRSAVGRVRLQSGRAPNGTRRPVS